MKFASYDNFEKHTRALWDTKGDFLIDMAVTEVCLHLAVKASHTYIHTHGRTIDLTHADNNSRNSFSADSDLILAQLHGQK